MLSYYATKTRFDIHTTFTSLRLCLELGHRGTFECLFSLGPGVIPILRAFKLRKNR